MIPLHDDNPTATRPLVTVGLIVICTLVFLWELSLDRHQQVHAIYSYGAIPAVILGHMHLAPDLAVIPPAATVLTSMFLHGGWLHLLGNMLFLWIFGNNVEDAMGHGRFVAFYFLSGIAAALTQSLFSPMSTVPMIGASGAISGVLGAYLLLYPHARVLVLLPLGFFVTVVRLPALIVLGLWFVMQLLSETFSAPGAAGVAFLAHVGGFVAGMALLPGMKRRGVRLFHPGH